MHLINIYSRYARSGRLGSHACLCVSKAVGFCYGRLYVATANARASTQKDGEVIYILVDSVDQEHRKAEDLMAIMVRHIAICSASLIHCLFQSQDVGTMLVVFLVGSLCGWLLPSWLLQ